MARGGRSMHNDEGTMWPKPDSKGINGDAGHKGETVKLSRGGAPQQNGVTKNGDADKLLGSVRSGDGEKDSGEWMRRAIYQVRLKGGPQVL